MDLLTRLKQRKPWRGHIGQRALVPGRWMRKFVAQSHINWHEMVVGISMLMLGAAALLPHAETQSLLGWVATVGLCLVVWLQVCLLRGIAWMLVARPLSGEGFEFSDFRRTLEMHPDCMAAVMHWLTPETVLRVSDKRLLDRIIALKKKEKEMDSATLQDRGRLLGEAIKALDVDRFHGDGRGRNITAEGVLESQEAARGRCKSWDRAGWPARVVSKLAINKNVDLEGKIPETPQFRNLLFNSLLIWYPICALVWMTQAWMGSAATGRDILFPFELHVMLPILLVLALPVPIATLLHYYFYPLSDKETQIAFRDGPFKFAAGIAYLQALRPDHEWTLHDVVVARALMLKLHFGNDDRMGELSVVGSIASPISPPIVPAAANEEYQEPVVGDWAAAPGLQKPWRGTRAQRLLLPTRLIQDLGNDLSARPTMSTCLVVLCVLALLMPIGALASVGSVASMFLMVFLLALQFELMRLVCYINVSIKLSNFYNSFPVSKLIDAIPGGQRALGSWVYHPSGIRVADLRALRALASRHVDVKTLERPFMGATIYDTEEAYRSKILGNIMAKSAAVEDERVVARAKSAGRAIDPWKLLETTDHDTRDAVMVLCETYLLSPRLSVLGALVVASLVYAALGGVVWMIQSYLGLYTQAMDIILPLGWPSTLALAGVVVVVIGAGAMLLNRCVAPVCVLASFERETLIAGHAGQCLAYLQNLPSGRSWTFQDLFRARALIKQAEKATKKTRQEDTHARYIGKILDTKEAAIGFSNASAEQMEENTPEVEEVAPPPVRRL